MSNQKTIDTSDLIPMDMAMLGRSYVHKWQTVGMNTNTYDYWVHRLRCIAMTSFEWHGFDSTLIDPRYIELCLLDNGAGALFDMYDSGTHLGFAQMVPMTRLNMYWNPRRVHLLPANGGRGWYRHAEWWTKRVGFRRMIMRPDAVVLYDNINRKQIMPIIRMFARRLANIDRKMDININAQSTPWIATGTEMQRKDLINLFAQISGNEPFIMDNGSKNNDPLHSQMEVLRTEAPYVADKLQATKRDLLADTLTMLGIDNANTEKREREIDAEATSNNEDILLMRKSRLSTRRQFCDQVNELFGTQISVSFGAPHLPAGDPDMGAFDNPEEDENENDGNSYAAPSSDEIRS